MTIEEKAKAYDEALERAKQIKNGENGWGYSDLVEITPALEEVFPELRENEDERIRKALIDALKVSETIGELKFRLPYPTREECIAYLEKQKEFSEHGYGLYYYHNGGFTFVARPAEEEKQKEQPMSKDEEIREHLINICNEWLGGGYNARPCLNDVRWLKNLLEKQKEQKPVDYEHEMWKNCEANFEGGKKEVIEHPEKYGLQKEQKPIFKKGDKVIWDDEEFNILDVNETEYNVGGYCVPFSRQNELHPIGQKPAEQDYDNRIQYDSVKSGIKAFASTYSFNIESKLFPQLTKEQQQLWRKEIEQAVIAGGEDGIELARDSRYKENRTVEWSEEDEKHINLILLILDRQQCWDGATGKKFNPYQGEIDWLKSLRP